MKRKLTIRVDGELIHRARHYAAGSRRLVVVPRRDIAQRDGAGRRSLVRVTERRGCGPHTCALALDRRSPVGAARTRHWTSPPSPAEWPSPARSPRGRSRPATACDERRPAHWPRRSRSGRAARGSSHGCCGRDGEGLIIIVFCRTLDGRRDHPHGPPSKEPPCPPCLRSADQSVRGLLGKRVGMNRLLLLAHRPSGDGHKTEACMTGHHQPEARPSHCQSATSSSSSVASTVFSVLRSSAYQEGESLGSNSISRSIPWRCHSS